MIPQAASAGARNLMQNCAEIERAERVLIVNAEGKVDEDLAGLMHEIAGELGAHCVTLWIPPLDKKAAGLPVELETALGRAEKIIFNTSINRVLLNRYLQGRDVVEIHNYYPTRDAMSSPDAAFDWRELRRLFMQIEQAFVGAARWSIRTDAGTNLHGAIAGPTDVAGAFFGKPGASLRHRRVFPGEVYSPVGVTDVEGTVAVQYINELDDLAWREPVRVLVKGSRISGLEGKGPERTKLESLLNEKERLHGERALEIDSWHGGMNPSARVPTAENPSLEGARTSPSLMHVHLGTQLDTISAGMLRAVVEVDGRVIFDHGHCALIG